MGYKSLIKSICSSIRKNERESVRRQKDYEKNKKNIEKLEYLQRARYEVEEYENYLDMILSMRKDCNEVVIWSKLNNIQEPSECMKYFICNMNFKKSDGLFPVDKIESSKYL